MTPFFYLRVHTLQDALAAARQPDAMLLAGGTTLVDLMRANVLQPRTVVDISGIAGLARIEASVDGFRFGALAKMADVAADARLRQAMPALSESLQQAASQQLRNMATVGGNLLQRTRCPYFRDGHSACNKRQPGSGCAALDGFNRDHAILGGSDDCIAAYPGDWAIALVAFDAEIEAVSEGGTRTLPVAQLHREPGSAPQHDTRLQAGEIITAIRVPRSAAGRKSVFLKLRDRQSYAFAIASAAVGLEMEGDRVRAARIAVGGVATRPWRSPEAEQVLQGRRLDERSALEAGHAAFAQARAREGSREKPAIGARAVAQALLLAARKGEA